MDANGNTKQACTVIELRIADHDHSIDIPSLIVRSFDRFRYAFSDLSIEFRVAVRLLETEGWISFIVAAPLQTEP